MNKTLLSAALIAGFGVAAFAPQSAKAAATDGTITITGKVVAQTCKVDGNAFGTSDAVAVSLPLVLAPVLTTSGAVAGKTSFQMAVTGCDASLSTVQAFFSGTNIDPTSGNLTNVGTATKVQVQLLNSSSVVMPLNGATAALQQSPVVALSAGGATLQYFAQYISTGGSTAGTVTTSVAFTMNYL
jgi:major type 1 subunit fimbrin (pilin)